MLMTIQNEATMSKEEGDRKLKIGQKVSEHLLSMEEYGEQLEEQRLKEILERMRAQKKE